MTGLKSLGQRELNYRMIFLANNVEIAGHGNHKNMDAMFTDDDYCDNEEDDRSMEEILKYKTRDFSKDELTKFEKWGKQEDLYDRMA